MSPNFTSVPDEFFDELIPLLTNAEMRVLLYIIRRTFGFKKQTDAIALSQMVDGIVRKDGMRLDAGTGLKKAAVCRALASLEKSGVILRKKQYASSGGAIATSYQLHMHAPSLRPAKQAQTPVYAARQGSKTPCLRTETGAVCKERQTLSTRRDTQETVTNKQVDKNVNVSKKHKSDTNRLYLLPNVSSEAEHIDLIAADILAALGDHQSAAFYHLVAAKVPEGVIRTKLSELKQGGAESKARVFTRAMMRYAEREVAAVCEGPTAALQEDRERLLKRLTYE